MPQITSTYELVEYATVYRMLNPNGPLNREFNRMLEDRLGEIKEFNETFNLSLHKSRLSSKGGESLKHIDSEYMQYIDTANNQFDQNAIIEYLNHGGVEEPPHTRQYVARQILLSRINFPGLERHYSDRLDLVITGDIRTIYSSLDEIDLGHYFQYKPETTKERSDRFWKYYNLFLKDPTNESLLGLLDIFRNEEIITPNDFDPRKLLQDLKLGKSNKYLPKNHPRKFEQLLTEMLHFKLIKKPAFSSKL
jgi:hypothetical protein